ncbi:hypothetical protein ADK51_25580 [Streptomyces sp. WM6368]|nr:hypothetical protein ADK51_25580 [Streptomyces sp. WM6368]
MLQVHVPPVQADQLAPAQPKESRHEDEGSVAGLDGFGQRVDLLDRDGRTFRGVHGAGALDLAGVSPDQLVGHGGPQDGAEQGISLGDRGGEYRLPGLCPWPAYCQEARTSTVSGCTSSRPRVSRSWATRQSARVWRRAPRVPDVYAIRFLDALDSTGLHVRSHDGRYLLRTSA